MTNWAGPWALPAEVFGFLKRNLKPEATILELGSGDGTQYLVDNFAAVYSVEHSEEWLGRVAGTHYIHAPLNGVWYDPEALRAGLPDHYDCLIIDGPPQNVSRRNSILKHLDMFKPVPTIVDDIQHGHGRDITVALAAAWKPKHYSVHVLSDARAFATIGWDDL